MNNEQLNQLSLDLHRQLIMLSKSICAATVQTYKISNEKDINEVAEVFKIQGEVKDAFLEARINTEMLLAHSIFDFSEPTEEELERRRILELKT